jgi:hypothetical protein
LGGIQSLRCTLHHPSLRCSLLLCALADSVSCVPLRFALTAALLGLSRFVFNRMVFASALSHDIVDALRSGNASTSASPVHYGAVSVTRRHDRAYTCLIVAFGFAVVACIAMAAAVAHMRSRIDRDRAGIRLASAAVKSQVALREWVRMSWDDSHPDVGVTRRSGPDDYAALN